MTLPTLYRRGYLIGKGLEDEIPLDYIMTWFRTTKSKILILQSSTGSGKSTVLPPEFYEQINAGKYITCTQPRIVTATTLPDQIVKYYTDRPHPLVLGYNLGFQTGFVSRTPSVPGIIYMTVGVLTAQLINMTDEEVIGKYSCIFIDEAHERSSEIDIVLYLIKEFLDRNKTTPGCPFVIIMSATLDIPKFTTYFETKEVIEVKGETYPVTKTFIRSDSKSIAKDTVDAVITYHENNMDQKEFTDILVFLPGVMEINTIFSHLNDATKKRESFKTHPVMLVKVHKETIDRNPKEIKLSINDLRVTVNNISVVPYRRVFLATNAVETGVTLPTLICVIDAGFYKSMEFNPIHETYSLISKPVTQSMNIQRCGRVGRLFKGDAITLFSKETFDKLYKDSFPSIIKEDNILDILNIITKISEVKQYKAVFDTLQAFDPKPVNIFKVNLFEQPSIYNINNALNALFYLGAIDKNGLLTKGGILLGRCKKIRPHFFRTILVSYCYDNIAVIDLVNMVSILSKLRSNDIKRQTIEPLYLNDDFINSILYMEKLLESSSREISMNKHIFEERENILHSMMISGLNPFKNYNKRLITMLQSASLNEKIDYIKTLKKCIYEGFKLNVLQKIVSSSGNGSETKYVNRFNDNIQASGINVFELKPEFLITSKVLLKDNIKTGIFSYKTEFTCILDGFVNIDLYFDVNV